MTRELLAAGALVGVGLLMTMMIVIPATAFSVKAERKNIMKEEFQRRHVWMISTISLSSTILFLLFAVSWPLQDLVENLWSPRVGIFLFCVFAIGIALALAYALRQSGAVPLQRGRKLAIMVLATIIVVSTALAVLLLWRGAISPEWGERSAKFYAYVVTDPKTVVHAIGQWAMNTLQTQGIPPIIWLAILCLWLIVTSVGIAQCPYESRHTLHGSARLATLSDLKRWKRPRATLFSAPRRAMNLLDTGGIVLGNYVGKAVQCNQTLSCLVLARPGAGKTAGIAMPTILSEGMVDWSLFIFDIKGELYDMSSGWRSRFGPVLRFEPKGRNGARWNPLSPAKSLPDGLRYSALNKEILALLGKSYSSTPNGAVFARAKLLTLMDERSDWRKELRKNPEALSESDNPGKLTRNDGDALVTLAEELRLILGDWETYFARLAAAMLPESKGGGGNSKHFEDTGREALFALMGFVTFRCLDLGEEPTMGKVVDAWADAANQADEIMNGDKEKGSDSPIKDMLKAWIAECETKGYPPRYRRSLTTLMAKATEELAGVISTADRAMSIFKLATVKENTSESDFAIDDLRGIKGTDGVSRPVTVYVVVSLEDIKAMAPILMMLTEVVQNRLISQPASVAKKSRPVLFILDEFAQIPKMQCLLSGPAVGRGQRVANLLIAQSFGQIEENYGQSGVKTLTDTTEWKIVFSLTDSKTAQEFSQTIGKTTVVDESFGRQSALAALMSKGGGGGKSINTRYQGVPLFEPSELMSEGDESKIRPGEHLVVVASRASRPILVRTPYFFEKKNIQQRAELPPPPYATARGYCGTLAKLSTVKIAENDDEIIEDAQEAEARGKKLLSSLYEEVKQQKGGQK